MPQPSQPATADRSAPEAGPDVSSFRKLAVELSKRGYEGVGGDPHVSLRDYNFLYRDRGEGHGTIVIAEPPTSVGSDEKRRFHMVPLSDKEISRAYRFNEDLILRRAGMDRKEWMGLPKTTRLMDLKSSGAFRDIPAVGAYQYDLTREDVIEVAEALRKHDEKHQKRKPASSTSASSAEKKEENQRESPALAAKRRGASLARE